MVAAHPIRAIAPDLLALPDERRAEIVDGVIVEKAAPAPDHGDAQAGLIGLLRRAFHRKPGGGRPGGWWILCEVEVELEEHQVFRPDVVGWRGDRLPERPKDRPVNELPDWVCEILSPSNAATDLVDKFRVYERRGVAHYWIADPERGLLTVYRCEGGRYTVALQAKKGETVRAEPFDAVELRVGELFGEEAE